ncbi:hypothetical protein BC941DRAFT_414969 [Chlamydoabsidia padenii]|nr:hypothetical protein BC941DRAFT_414969 [Chlamydoabsidia padenii]
MTNNVCEFTPSQQKNVERFCKDYYSKNKMQQLVNATLHRGKKWWSYGVVAIVAHALTGHTLWSPSTTWFTKSPTTTTPPTQMFLMELALWSASLGMAWYAWLTHLHGTRVMERTRIFVDSVEQAHRQPHSNVWVMVENNGSVTGVAILKCEHRLEEGQIKVAGLGSRIELALVQNAIQFARQQGIKVVTQEHRNNELERFI